MIKKISFSKFIFLIFFPYLAANSLDNFSNIKNYKVSETKYKLTEVMTGLDYPWGMTFIDKNNLLVTQKNGELLKVNVIDGRSKKISHNIENIFFKGGAGQGGLLDVLHNNGIIYFSYSHYDDENSSLKGLREGSTAIGKGKLINDRIENFENLLVSKPKFNSNLHWGSRLAIKDNHIYASLGERGMGMIAQDPTKHPGSIIRINIDGSIPKNNPANQNKNYWLPEIFQIGLRNPQGMTISPFDENIYFSQHGPKGGDNIGIVKFAGNYGWKDIAWGGKEYSGKKIGNVSFKKKYDENLISWVPSIGVSQIAFYKGNEFPEWNGDLIGGSLKYNIFFKIRFEDKKIISEEIIFKNKIGRIRDFELNQQGEIFIITDHKNSSLWKLSR